MHAHKKQSAHAHQQIQVPHVVLRLLSSHLELAGFHSLDHGAQLLALSRAVIHRLRGGTIITTVYFNKIGGYVVVVVMDGLDHSAQLQALSRAVIHSLWDAQS